MNCICHYLFTFLIEINVGTVIISLSKMCDVQVLYKTVNRGQKCLTLEGCSDYLILSFAHFMFVFTLTR